MTTHRDVVPELRKLAQAVLDGVDPAVRAAAARAFAGGPARCQQVWCPVCALAALMAGEQHPLLAVVADHSVSLLSTIRTLLDDMAGAATAPNRRHRAAVAMLPSRLVTAPQRADTSR